MIALMACALSMAIAMPSAFTAKAGLFVGAYVVMALLRASYMALVFRGSRMGRNYAQLGACGLYLLERNQQVFIIALGESILFLVGGMLFFRVMAQTIPWAYSIATALLITLGYLASVLHLPGLIIGGAILLILLVLATFMQLRCEKVR